MTTLADYRNQLKPPVPGKTTNEGSMWLDSALADIAEDSSRLLPLSAQAQRHLGQQTMGAELAEIRVDGDPLLLGHKTAGDIGRMLMILTAVAHHPEAEVTLVEDYFRQGDEEERCALVSSLSLLPQAEAHVPVAQEAGRANSLQLYATLAQGNPYPAQYYQEHDFNQIVLKSLFTGLGTRRIVGLKRRANPDLTRMCTDYVQERLDADRDVPRDIWLAIAPHADARGEAFMARFLSDSDADHRFFVALAVARLAQPSDNLLNAVAARRDQEPDPDVQRQLAKIAS